jgi:hypothetical protein
MTYTPDQLTILNRLAADLKTTPWKMQLYYWLDQGRARAKNELCEQLVIALAANGVDMNGDWHGCRMFTDYWDGEYEVKIFVGLKDADRGIYKTSRKFTPRSFATLVKQITEYLDKYGCVQRDAGGDR